MNIKNIFKTVKEVTDKRLKLEDMMGEVHRICADLMIVAMRVKDIEWETTLSPENKKILTTCMEEYEKLAGNILELNGNLQEKYFRFCAEYPQDINTIYPQYSATQTALGDAVKYSYLISIKAGNTALPLAIKTIIDMYENTTKGSKIPLFGSEVDPKNKAN